MPLRPSPAALVLVTALASPVASAQQGEGGSNGLVVRLTLEGNAAEPPFTAVITGPGVSLEVPLNDEGEGSDALAGDGSWSGSGWADGDSFQVSLTTAGGTLAGGEISWPPDALHRDVVMKLGSDGLSVVGEVADPSVTGDRGAAGAPGGRSGAGSGQALGLVVALAIAAVLLAAAIWLGAFARGFHDTRALRTLQPARPPEVRGLEALPPEDSVHRPVGVAPAALVEHLVTDLVRSGPVVMVAPPGLAIAVPPGQVHRFEGSPGQLARALRALLQRSMVPPSLVALVEPPDPRRIEDLAQNLPDSVHALFVVGAAVALPDVPQFTWRQDPDGWRAAPTGHGNADEERA
jgi:hypothetical protein